MMRARLCDGCGAHPVRLYSIPPQLILLRPWSCGFPEEASCVSSGIPVEMASMLLLLIGPLFAPCPISSRTLAGSPAVAAPRVYKQLALVFLHP